MPSEEEGWAHCGSICYTQWPRFAQMPQLTTFSQQRQNIQNIENSRILLTFPPHSPPVAPLPKDLFWEKHISKFDWEVVIKPAVRKGAERSMDDFVSLWTCSE